MRHKLLVLTVKKCLQSVYIYGSYRKIKTGVPFFLDHPVEENVSGCFFLEHSVECAEVNIDLLTSASGEFRGRGSGPSLHVG